MPIDLMALFRSQNLNYTLNYAHKINAFTIGDFIPYSKRYVHKYVNP